MITGTQFYSRKGIRACASKHGIRSSVALPLVLPLADTHEMTPIPELPSESPAWTGFPELLCGQQHIFPLDSTFLFIGMLVQH